MKTLWFIIIVCAAATSYVEAGTNEIYLLSHSTNKRDCEWYLSLDKNKTMPKWNPLKEQLPFPAEKAVKMASDWIKKTEKLNFEPELWSIILRPIQPNEKEFKYSYFYVLKFGTGLFQTSLCVILMDGTILEPRSKYGLIQK